MVGAEAEAKIQKLREEMRIDRAKLEALEMKAEAKRNKRKERKARKKAEEETEPVSEKRARRDSNNSRSVVRGPSQEEPRPDNRM